MAQPNNGLLNSILNPILAVKPKETEETLKTEGSRTKEIVGAFNINQKVIENKIFNIEEDVEEDPENVLKCFKGKRHKVDDSGDMTYFNNKK